MVGSSAIARRLRWPVSTVIARTFEAGSFVSCSELLLVCYSDLLLVDENFDPAVGSPPARGAVIGNRLARSVGDHTNLRRVDAFLAD